MEFVRKDTIDIFLLESKNFKDESKDNIMCIAGNALKISEFKYITKKNGSI
jgi:hypothetical protein